MDFTCFQWQFNWIYGAMQNPKPVLLELFNLKTKEKNIWVFKQIFSGIYRTNYNILVIYRTITEPFKKKLCIQNNVLYTELDGSTAYDTPKKGWKSKTKVFLLKELQMDQESRLYSMLKGWIKIRIPQRSTEILVSDIAYINLQNSSSMYGSLHN